MPAQQPQVPPYPQYGPRRCLRSSLRDLRTRSTGHRRCLRSSLRDLRTRSTARRRCLRSSLRDLRTRSTGHRRCLRSSLRDLRTRSTGHRSSDFRHHRRRASPAGFWVRWVVTVLFVLLLFAGCSAFVNGINEGGNHQEKVRTMMGMADNLPESDWQLVGRFDPKVEQGCLSIDIECVRLNASWSVPHEVTVEDAAARLGLDCSDSARTNKGCPRKTRQTASLQIFVFIRSRMRQARGRSSLT